MRFGSCLAAVPQGVAASACCWARVASIAAMLPVRPASRKEEGTLLYWRTSMAIKSETECLSLSNAATAPVTSLSGTHVTCDLSELRDFRGRWAVRRMWIYGSATRDDFGEGSDIDVLCDFGSDSLWFYENSPGSKIDYRLECRAELSDILGRTADILSTVDLQAERNHLKREHILEQAVSVHEL